MSRQSENPVRLFIDPFAAWRELALKTGEMILASAQAGAARASTVRVAVIDERQPAPPAARPKPRSTKKHKKRAKRR